MINSYCLSHNLVKTSKLWVFVHGVILSLTTEVMYITVFPGFQKNYPMILVQELQMTLTVVSIDSPSM